MSKNIFIPGYLADDYHLLTENIESYKDPEEPDLLNNYVDSLLAQLNRTPEFLAGMPDQLAICLLLVVKLDSAKLSLLSSQSEPTWDEVKTCVSIHKRYRPLLSTLVDKFQHPLKIALLLLCFYELDATTQEFNAQEDESEELEEHDDYEEYHGQDQDFLDQF